MFIKGLIFTIFTLAIFEFAIAREDLVVVQTISSDRRNFVLLKGLKDGIARGQEVIISNENVSIVCKAIEVSRELSLWVPIEKNLNIPFNKQDIISMNTHSFGNVGVDIEGIVSKLIPDNEIELAYGKLRSENAFAFRYSYGAAISQSASSVGATENSKKSGQDFSIEYGIRLSPTFEISLGARLDYEIYRLTTPELDIPTTRKIATMAITYHLVNFSKSKNNFYATIALGIGSSTTTINDSNSTGLATVLPQVRLGYLIPLSDSKALVIEAGVESVSSREKFSTGVEQNSSQVNTKASIGLRF